MRFTVSLLVEQHEAHDPRGAAASVAALAQEAERVGYDAVYVTDHPAPDSRWLAGGGHQAYEPTVVLTAAAAATTTIRVHTHVYVLSYRNPFLAARSLASVDILSGGRLIVGVAAGYLRPEFGALGVPFDERNARTDESLVVLRHLWRGEVVAGDGVGWSARGVRQEPPTVSEPGPPIWIGGNSGIAMQRAAALGDGWSPFPTPAGLSQATKTAEISDVPSLARRVARFRELCSEVGRTEPLDICMGSFHLHDYLWGRTSAARVVDELGEMAALGVTWTAVGLTALTVEAARDQMACVADEIINPLRDT